MTGLSVKRQEEDLYSSILANGVRSFQGFFFSMFDDQPGHPV